MAETVNGLTIKVSITGSIAGDNGSRLAVDITKVYAFQDGTGSTQIGNMLYKPDRALNNTSETLDLDGLTDFQGASTSTFNNVKFQYYENNSTTAAQNLTIGGGDFSGMFADPSDKLVIGPGGIALIVSPIDGYPITATTGDGLLIATNANMTYDLLLGVDNA